MGYSREIADGNRVQIITRKKKQYKIFGRRSEKILRHGRPKQTSAREGRRLKMLSKLGRLKTTLELFFDWIAIFGTHLSYKTVRRRLHTCR